MPIRNPGLDDIYKELENKLNAMTKPVAGNRPQSQFRIEADKQFPDRVTIYNRNYKSRMSLNLSQQEAEHGQKVWLIGSNKGDQYKLPMPQVKGIYDRETGDIGYEAFSSNQQFVRAINQTFMETPKGGDVTAKFHEIMNMGHQGLGMKPFPSIPRGWQATQATSISQIDFSIQSNKGFAYPEEERAVYGDFARQYGAFEKGMTPKVIHQGSLEKGGAQLQFKNLVGSGYLFKDTGTMIPMFGTQPSMLQESGKWFHTQDPLKFIKSPNLSSGSEPVFPYRLEGGVPTRVQAGITTNVSRPAFALSNVRFPKEDDVRGYERRGTVYDATEVPGGALKFHNPASVKADFFGHDSTVTANIKGLNLNDLLEGRQKIELDNFSNKTYGGGTSMARFGTFTSGDQQEPINVRFGAGQWIPSGGGSTLNLPAYVNPNTGKFFDKEERGAVPTEQFIPRLREKVGGNIQVARGSEGYLTFGGVAHAASSVKGPGVKQGAVITGFQSRLGKEGPYIDYVTSERKNAADMYGYFGGLSYKQIYGLASQWEKNQPGYGAQIKQYLKENYSGVNRELGIDMEALAGNVGYGEKGGGLGMMMDWFSGTIGAAEPGSVRNRRNIQQYGAGWVGGRKAQYLASESTVEEIRYNNLQAAKQTGLSEEEAQQRLDKYWKFDKQDTGAYKVTRTFTENAMYMNMLTPRRTEHIHGPRMNQIWLQAMGEQYPGIAEKLGAGLANFRPRGKQQTAALGILQHAVWQGQMQDARESGENAESLPMPENYKEVSDTDLSVMQAHLQGQDKTGVSAVDRIRNLADKFYDKDSGVNADTILYNKTAGFLPNPRAAANATFSELGVNSAGIAKPVLGLYEKLGGIVSAEGKSLEERREMAYAAQKPTLAYAQKLITGSGDFLKRLMSKVLDTSVSGNYSADLLLEHGEARVPYDRAEQVARQSGAKSAAAVHRGAREIQESGAPLFAHRQPGLGGVQAYRNIPESKYRARWGENQEEYQRAIEDPEARGLVTFPLSQSRAEVGDLDRDKMEAALGITKQGGRFVPVEGSDTLKYENFQSVGESERRRIADPGLRGMVGATTGQFVDFQKGVSPFAKGQDQKQMYSPQESMEASVSRLLNKKSAMATGYNLGRATVAAAYSQDRGQTNIERVRGTSVMQYQAGLDTLLKGSYSVGTPVSYMMSRSYVNEKNGEPNLHMVTSSMHERQRRTIVDEKGQEVVLPQMAYSKKDFNLNEMRTSRQGVLNATNFLAETYAQGFDVKGQNVSLTPSQFAAEFAFPGDEGELESRLDPKQRSSWTPTVGHYFSEKLDQVASKGGSIRSGIEAVLSTNAFQTLMTAVGAKAMSDYNPETGESTTPKSRQTFKNYMKEMSPAYQEKLGASITLADTKRRYKMRRLESLHPRNLANAARNLGTGIETTAMRSLATMVGVGWENAPSAGYSVFDDEQGRPAPQGPSVDEMFGPPQPDPDALMQGLLDKQAAVQKARMNNEPIPEVAFTSEEKAILGIPSESASEEPVTNTPRRRDSGKLRRRNLGNRGPSSSGAGGGDRGGGGIAPPAGMMDDDGPKIPADKLREKKPEWQGVARRVGIELRGIAGATRQYQQGELSRIKPYLHNLLTEMSYEGEDTPESIRERFETAFTSDRKGLLSRISPAMMKQIHRVSKLQQATARASIFADEAPGLAGDERNRIRGIVTKALDPRSPLGQDIETAGHIPTMVKDLMPSKPFMAQAAIELANRDDFTALHGQLQPFMNKPLTSEAMAGVRGVLSNTPYGLDMLRRAKAIKEKPEAIPGSVSEMRGFAEKMEAVEPGIMKSGTRITSQTTAEIEKLTETFTKLQQATKSVNEISQKRLEGDTKQLQQEEQKARFEEKKASAAFRSQLYGGLGEEQTKATFEAFTRLKDSGGAPSTALMSELAKSAKDTERFEASAMKAQQESEMLQSQEGGSRVGSFVRGALGGFGLMYMRSIFGVATSGLGYGMGEREKLDNTISQGMYASTGNARIPYNQQQNISSMQALYGTNNNPVSGIAEYMARTPIARDIYNVGAAGIGSFSFAQWGLTSALGMSDKQAMKYSVGTGVGVAALSMMADVSSRTQDPASLGFRLAQSSGPGGGMPGFNDAMAAGWMQLTDDEGYQQYQKEFGIGKILSSSFDNGLSINQMKQTKVIDRSGTYAASGIPTFTTKDGTNRQYANASDIMSSADIYGGIARQLKKESPNITDETAAQTAGFLMRTPDMSISDPRLKGIQNDYQLGGWAAQTSQSVLKAGGYNASQMYGSGKLSELQLRYANEAYDEPTRQTMAEGIQAVGQIRGASYIEGFGKHSKSAVTDETLDKFIVALGKIVESPAFEAFSASASAADASRRAGMNYQMPNISDYSSGMTPEQATRSVSLSQAQEQAATSRIGYAQKFASYAASLGDPNLGAGLYDTMMQTKPGEEWKTSRLLNGDPLMMAQKATSGFDWNQIAGPTNVQGIQYNSSVLANTDISNQGRITGLAWGSTGLQRGSISAQQMGQNIFGNMKGAGVDAAVNGVNLQQPVTMWDGTQVSSVGGQMGLTVLGNQLEQNYQESMFKFQSKGFERDTAYQMKVWGIQDRQRDLSYQHQMQSFGFQEQGMALQEKGMEMNNKFFWSNMSINRQQTETQRGWTTQDWSMDANTRAMQWGWKVDDFQEQQRFMTGRDRRLAERGMERETTMYEIESGKIDRSQDRQRELWRIEDERFSLQKEQQHESISLQREQFSLQQEQFQENKKYYLEAKKLEDELIKLQRQHWLESNKAAREQLEITQKYQKEMLELRKTSDQMSIAFQLLQGAMNTFVDDSMKSFQESLINSGSLIATAGANATQFTQTVATQISNSTNITGSNNQNPFAGGGGYTPIEWGGSLSNAPISSYGTLGEYAGSNSVFQGSLTTNYNAAGGDIRKSMSKVQVTGEEGPEFVIDGQIIPHNISKKLAKAGITAGMASGTAKSIIPQVFPAQESRSKQYNGGRPQTVIVKIGNREIKRFIVEAVEEEF